MEMAQKSRSPNCFQISPKAVPPTGTGLSKLLQKEEARRVSSQLVKKGFDKLVDGEASSPATATLTSLR